MVKKKEDWLENWKESEGHDNWMEKEEYDKWMFYVCALHKKE